MKIPYNLDKHSFPDQKFENVSDKLEEKFSKHSGAVFF